MAKKTVHDHLAVPENPGLQSVANQIRDEIIQIGPGIREYSTQAYVGYKLTNNRQIAAIHFRKKSIMLYAHLVGPGGNLLPEPYKGITIRQGNEYYAPVMNEIRKAYSILSRIKKF